MDGRRPSGEALVYGATRLSLLDAPQGGQPMEDGDVAVVFNGEIYNHEELRAELEREGAWFSGRSDTEVLLRGFGSGGSALFERLEGMFALAIRAGSDPAPGRAIRSGNQTAVLSDLPGRAHARCSRRRSRPCCALPCYRGVPISTGPRAAASLVIPWGRGP